MVICIVWIVLCSIVFCNDRVYCQIQKKPQVTLFKIPTKELDQVVFFYNFTQYKICSHTQAAASGCPVFCLWKLCIWKIFQEILIRLHQFRVCFRQLSYCYSFWKSILPDRVINPVIFILNIYSILLFPTCVVFPCTNGILLKNPDTLGPPFRR